MAARDRLPLPVMRQRGKIVCFTEPLLVGVVKFYEIFLAGSLNRCIFVMCICNGKKKLDQFCRGRSYFLCPVFLLNLFLRHY